jgi:hypothetical protein
MLCTHPHFMKSMKSNPYPELFAASGFLFASKACRLAFLFRAFLRAAGLACGGSGVFSFGVGTCIGTGSGSGSGADVSFFFRAGRPAEASVACEGFDDLVIFGFFF